MADEIYANVTVTNRNYDIGCDFTVTVIHDGRRIAYKKGWRWGQEWAASAARRISKRMVKAEKRRAKSDRDNHIKEYTVG